MGKRTKLLLIAYCALALLLIAGGFVYLTKRQGDMAAQVIEQAVAQLDLHRANIALFEGNRKDYFSFDAECTRIDPENKQVDVIIRIIPSIYAKDSFTPVFYLGNERIDIAWNDDESVLTVHTKIGIYAMAKECRVVVEDKNDNLYQQSFPLAENVFSDFATGYRMFHGIFFEAKPGRIDGDVFRWNGRYSVGEDLLPFGSKMASARVYAYDMTTEKEVFSQEFKDGQATLDNEFHLTPGKTDLRLYGEVVCQEGMRYRYYLGEVREGDGLFYFNYNPTGSPPYYDGCDFEENYNVYAIFPDQTMIGLKTDIM